MRFLHTYNRGVDKRKIFMDELDYFRGVHDIYEFNDEDHVLNVSRRFTNKHEDGNDGNPISINVSGVIPRIHPKKRKLLIDLFAWSFMPNHYHFFSRERIPYGISKFHQKWGIGYTNYFNLRYERSGVLLQGKHKKVIVLDNNQASHLVCYIHANHLDLWRPSWKEEGISASDIPKAIKFLNDKKNRWSSHQDYWGVKNFPSLISREFLNRFFGGEKGYRRYFVNWLKQYKHNIIGIEKLIIEHD